LIRSGALFMNQAFHQFFKDRTIENIKGQKKKKNSKYKTQQNIKI